LSIVFLSSPLDFIDLLHFVSCNEDGGDGDDVVLEVAPHTVDEALFDEIVYEFAKLD
jgi:hypothetical protein